MATPIRLSAAARTTTHSMTLVALLLVPGIAACSRRDPEPVTATDKAPAPAAARTSTTALPLRDGDRALLHPIHAGVQVRVEPDAATVTYTRSRGKAFGAAYVLTNGIPAQHGGIQLTIRTQPSLRPQLCLTDAAGNVWNAPAVDADAPGQLRFDLHRLQPDPFQNTGRVLPDSADLDSMRMLTILDISGFMGGAEVPCEWTLESLALTPREDGVSSAGASGGAR